MKNWPWLTLGFVLVAGLQLTASPVVALRQSSQRPQLGFEVLLNHQASGTLVVHKRPGVATSLRVDQEHTSVINQVRRVTSNHDVELPHRLDRMTGGVLVMATTRDSLRFHNRAIQEKEWRKVYLARVVLDQRTDPATLLGEQKLYLRTIKGKGRAAKVVRSGGQPAILDVVCACPAEGQMVPPGKALFDVVIRLHTGRYHQIRATMAHLAAPVLSDALYGGAVGGSHSRSRGRIVQDARHRGTEKRAQLPQPILTAALLCLPLPPYRDAALPRQAAEEVARKTAVVRAPHLSLAGGSTGIAPGAVACLDDLTAEAIDRAGGLDRCVVVR